MTVSLPITTFLQLTVDCTHHTDEENKGTHAEHSLLTISVVKYSIFPDWQGIQIKHFHSVDGVFAPTTFCSDYEATSQRMISFSGIGAHHHNVVANHNIKTISQWACSMLRTAFRWYEHANVKLLPWAIDYIIPVFNLCHPSIVLSPIELWFQSQNINHNVLHTHPIGFPGFVFNPKLQDGNKVPKWETWASREILIGFFSYHSLLVPLVLNISTGEILS